MNPVTVARDVNPVEKEINVDDLLKDDPVLTQPTPDFNHSSKMIILQFQIATLITILIIGFLVMNAATRVFSSWAGIF